jgi:type IV pilus assembly protein PilX
MRSEHKPEEYAVINRTPTFVKYVPRQQHGAALVVGLLLLLVITLLAVAGMNSSALEFIMAGNEQYRQNAFQAAETGIEQTIVNGSFIPGAATVTQSNVAAAGSATDTYTTSLSSDLGGAPQPAIWGNSWDSFSTYDFTITSTGASVRNAKSTHVQGVAVLAPASPQPPPVPGTTAFD